MFKLNSKILENTINKCIYIYICISILFGTFEILGIWYIFNKGIILESTNT